ncbi:unnamed protein product, partial [Polarella glacialis]
VATAAASPWLRPWPWLLGPSWGQRDSGLSRGSLRGALAAADLAAPPLRRLRGQRHRVPRRSSGESEEDEAGIIQAEVRPIILNCLVELSYEGSGFAGTYYNRNDPAQSADPCRTVEGALEAALGACPSSGDASLVRMTILSRTDKGVSAAGTWALGSLQGRPEDGQQDTPAFQSWASETVAAANIWLVAAGINTSLKSIRALPVPLQGAAFHWEEKGPVAASLMGPKRYEYRVSPGADFDSEFRGNQGGYLAWQVPEKLDVEAMREAAAALVGTHNFAAFTSQHGWDKDPTRHLHHVTITPEKGRRRRESYSDPAGSEAEILVVSVYGVNFLYLMVRYIAFALVLVGRGVHPASWVPGLLQPGTSPTSSADLAQSGRRRKGRPPGVPSVGLRPAPAHGLCLAELQIEEAPSLESIRGVLAQGKPKSRRETREAANSLDDA